MSTLMPYFSIVIPTRNRPAWLGQSINAALNQEFQDLEIVVVDNSDSGESASSDVVGRIDSEKVRYIRTGGLSMAENWQTAVKAVHGQNFIICSDKLLLAPGLLELLRKEIDALGCEICVWKIGTEAQIALPLSKSEVQPVLVQGNDLWKCAGAGLWTIVHRAAARGMNSCIKTSLVTEVESRLGVGFCRPTNPDYVIGLSFSALGYDTWFFDVIGAGFIKNADGNGMLCLTAPDEEFVKNQFSYPEIADLPLPFAVGTNLIYQDILAINALLPSSDRIKINWENYFIQILHTAVNADDLGGFSEKRKAILLRVLAARPLRERLSLTKTICQQEMLNLLRGKYRFSKQVRRIGKLLAYSFPPIFGKLSVLN